jgi:hypothetical protein
MKGHKYSIPLRLYSLSVSTSPIRLAVGVWYFFLILLIVVWKRPGLHILKVVPVVQQMRIELVLPEKSQQPTAKEINKG